MEPYVLVYKSPVAKQKEEEKKDEESMMDELLSTSNRPEPSAEELQQSRDIY
jgi:hypothetical protein